MLGCWYASPAATAALLINVQHRCHARPNSATLLLPFRRALPVTADPGQLRVEVWNQNRAAPDDLVRREGCCHGGIDECLPAGMTGSR